MSTTTTESTTAVSSTEISHLAARGGQAPRGRRLVPQVVDQLAEDSPDKIWVSFPITNDIHDGLRDVTYYQYSNAINRCAWWLKDEIGTSETFGTIAYLGPHDPRYYILALAAIKTGWQTFLPSPRNSLEGNLRLLEQIDCNIFVTTENVPRAVQEIAKQRPMRLLAIPELDALLGVDTVPGYPYTKSFEDARFDPTIVIHTSGSTGFPKPIVIRHAWLNSSDYIVTIPDLEGGAPTNMSLMMDQRIFIPFPLFHAFGLGVVLCASIYWGVHAVLPPPIPLTVDVVDQMHQFSNVDGTCLPCSILADLCKEPEYLEHMKDFKIVIYGGGNLSTTVGNQLQSVLNHQGRVLNFLGTSETCAIPSTIPDREDWQYFSPSVNVGADFRQYEESSLYELVLVRDDKYELGQAVFATFPGLTEYHTKDLWAKHPTKPGFWLYTSRADDILVLATGEKVNPVTMEEHIVSQSRDLLGAVVTGQAQMQTALLVEPKVPVKTQQEKDALIEKIWPIVQQENQESVAHGRIAKEMIACTTPDKPFPRAGKGSVQKALALSMYSEEIKELYESAAASASNANLDMTNDQTAIASLHDIIAEQLGVENVSVKEDLFQLGFDSLQVINLARTLNRCLPKINLQPKNIYSNPTIAGLSAFLFMKSQGGHVNGGEEEEEGSRPQAVLERFTADLPITSRKPLRSPEKMTVLLTGSTGGLGSYLLDRLLSNPAVQKVNCLNRSDNARDRQLQNQESRSLSTDLDPDRVSFTTADFGKSHFGLSPDVYADLLASTTHILHNAWVVNFNLDLSSFVEPHVHGVRRLIDFSAASAFGASILFVSSISSVMRWAGSHGPNEPIPEQIFEDWSLADMGYGLSKAVSERMLAAAAKEANVPVALCRVGQVSGPTEHAEGAWSKKEWFPSLVQSSRFMKLVPRDLGTMEQIDWVPVDHLAQILTELLETNTPGSNNVPKVYHLVNPRPTPWSSLLPEVLATMPEGSAAVPIGNWVDALEASDGDDLEANPARKLLSFFEGLKSQVEQFPGLRTAVLETKITEGNSKALEELPRIDPAWVEAWCR